MLELPRISVHEFLALHRMRCADHASRRALAALLALPATGTGAARGVGLGDPASGARVLERHAGTHRRLDPKAGTRASATGVANRGRTAATPTPTESGAGRGRSTAANGARNPARSAKYSVVADGGRRVDRPGPGHLAD